MGSLWKSCLSQDDMKACLKSYLIRFRGLKLLLLLTTGVLLLNWISTAQKTITVQFKERDLVDYNLYHIELVRRSPVFHFVNLNNTFSHVSKVPEFSDSSPVIFVVTPTYTRQLQKAELTNMCNTMRQSSNIFWIVIEDTEQKTELVKEFLLHCGIPAVHMNFKSYLEPEYTIDQRNAAIEWIKRNTNVTYGNTVLYYADDDNTYDPEVFEEMRYTRKVSIWPVGLVGNVLAEGPIVKQGKVVDWASNAYMRKFPIDMAGFAVNVQFLNNKPAARFHHETGGVLETIFLEALGVEETDLEPMADNCSRVLVWHTQTKPVEGVVPNTRRGSDFPNWEV